jgi:gluconate 5-dehydrogenase
MSISLFDLTGRTALVTGSVRGLGNTLARGLAEAGATVVLNGLNAVTVSAAAAVLRDKGYLASSASNYVTGQLIFVDGGITAVL